MYSTCTIHATCKKFNNNNNNSKKQTEHNKK